MKKKLFSLLLIAVMVLSSFSAVFAGEVVIDNPKDGHTYEIYQILTGDVEAGVLINVAWGSSVGEAEKAGDADAFAKSLEGKSDAEVKSMVSGKATGTPFATVKDQTNGKYVFSNLPVGYYLVKDKDGSVATNDAYTAFIIKLVEADESIPVKPKSTVPSDNKEVKDETTDAEAGHTDGWGKSADHNINESFQFRLTASIPKNAEVANWTEYKITFVDTMSKGITFESIESVKINNQDYSEYSLSGVTEGQAGPATWRLTTGDIKNLIAAENSASDPGTVEIEVIYNAHLNEEAVVNAESGPTENVNNSHIEFTNKPDASGTGKTEDKPVYVFTFQVNNTKTFEGLGANETEPTAYFNLYQADGTTEIGLIWDAAKNAYRPIAEGETATAMDTTHSKTFNIVGLDAGTYVLKEQPLEGFNPIEPITIKIDATHKDNNVTLTNSCENMTNPIVNKKGATLPETGGMGTTIIYILGAALVIGAGVVLVSRKKVDNR